MLSTLRDKRLLWPTAMTVLALPILLALGSWQLDRLAWKEGLIASIAERVSQPPIGLGEANRRFLDTGEAEYVRVRARGRFHHDKERYLYAPDPDRGPGFQVITPFEVAGDGAILFVNRGWVPDALKEPALRAAGQAAGEVEVTGLLRRPESPGAFTPDNDPVRNLWYWRDFSGMFKASFENTERPYIPMFLDAEAGPPGTWPQGGTTRVALPNRHLEYAITWFGLAGALAAVYAAYVAGRLRGP
ncbi:MAG: SURF1 family protein [Hyphomicrobium sp.]